MTDRLTHEQSLFPGETLTSPEGQYELIMQTDGNLVIYDVWNGRSPVWASDTVGAPNTRAEMQDDGNLVIYWQQPLWASK